YSLENLNRQAGLLNCGPTALFAIDQGYEIPHFFPIRIGLLKPSHGYSGRSHYLHFLEGFFREGVGYVHHAFFEIEYECIARESERLRCVHLDDSVTAEDQRRDIVSGRMKTRVAAHHSDLTRAWKQIDQQINCMDSHVVKCVGAAGGWIEFPECI